MEIVNAYFRSLLFLIFIVSEEESAHKSFVAKMFSCFHGQIMLKPEMWEWKEGGDKDSQFYKRKEEKR